MTLPLIRVPTAPQTWSGYGMHVDTIARHRYWRKAGSVQGYLTEFGMWPDLGLAVVVSADALDEMPIRAHFLAAEIVTGLRLQRPAPVAERPPTRDEQRQVVGKYRGRANAPPVEIVEVDGRLEYRGTRLTYPLRMVSRDRLIAQPPGQPARTLCVIRDPDGTVRYLSSINAVLVKEP